VLFHFDAKVAAAELLGARGAGLSLAHRIGLPVPPGFTIAARASCGGGENRLPPLLRAQLAAAVVRLEERTGLQLGDPRRPLVLALASGSLGPFELPFLTGHELGRTPAGDLHEVIRMLLRKGHCDDPITIHRALRSDGLGVRSGLDVGFGRSPATGDAEVVGAFWPGVPVAGDGRSCGSPTMPRQR